MVSEDVEHSPLPWRASTFAVYDANGVPAAHTGACGRSNKQRIANAELIVRAVNSFSKEAEDTKTALITKVREYGEFHLSQMKYQDQAGQQDIAASHATRSVAADEIAAELDKVELAPDHSS